MVVERQEVSVEEQLGFLYVVCAAMILGVGAFAVMAWVLVDRPGATPLVPADAPVWLTGFGLLVAVALLLAAPLLHRRLLDRSVAPEDRGRLAPALENYRLATLLAFVLREGAAMIGLMLALATGQALWAYALAAATVVAMFWGWPRREEVASLLGRAAVEMPPA
ncbi:MAG TPA: hypothetical protein VMT16_02345 [Thermoanaerobaculia bacterium]|nr:hypothetical protein [Thermoanaerobaculia bacterium]